METTTNTSQILLLYNPQLQSAEMVEKLFVIRQEQFSFLLEGILREKENSIPQHYLITGQRGMGKTTILKRLEIEFHKEQYREAVRIQKELAKQQKEYERLSMLEQAALEVKQYDNYIERLLTIHRDCSDEYNWIELEKTQPPSQPIFRNKPNLKQVAEIHDNENYYTNIIDNYKPNFFARLFKVDRRKLKTWKNLLEQGKEDDKIKTQNVREQVAKDYDSNIKNWEKECENLKKKYEEDFAEYTELINLANKVNNGNLDSFAYIIQEVEPFKEISEFGSEVEVAICSRIKAKAIIQIHDDTVIPKQAKTLLKSGKVSVKDMAIGRFNEIYQDYICSVALRIARDLFAILPLEEVIVTAKGNCLDKTTGRMEIVPLLSVLFVREIMKNLNFDAIDPSDAMKNFKCNMSFKKSQGMDSTNELSF